MFEELVSTSRYLDRQIRLLLAQGFNQHFLKSQNASHAPSQSAVNGPKQLVGERQVIRMFFRCNK